ncbi:alpha/beta fold hydrolase [Roseobacter sp. S98]|uniref:alpha/beta fold hydrolase n=1 Tax=Roseobacter algicola (ex Choi et al. 2025) (nom. illeg.) TaxID=3092138 RepID=UPI0035C719B9
MTASRFLDGFTVQKAALPGISVNYARAGSGPPVLLLHGHPQTHIVWRGIAPQLVAAGYQVIAPDLRGYGDSDKPASDAAHLTYSKRVMAQDQIALMASLGHDRFAVVGHDRGGRVAHRLALDFPDAVERLAVLDIAPTLTMYDRTDQEFATRYFWWFFLIQPNGLPEKMFGSDPEYFLRRHIAGQVKVEGAVSEEAIAEYLRTYRDPATIHAICEDYRASASIDLEHDRAEPDRRVTAPLLAIWGEKSVVGALYDVEATWQEKAEQVTGCALPCGHAIPEEAPDALLEKLLGFLP